jgi:hypothetical protein
MYVIAAAVEGKFQAGLAAKKQEQVLSHLHKIYVRY